MRPPDHPLLAGQVREAGVPPVREQLVLAGLLVAAPAELPAPVLIRTGASGASRIASAAAAKASWAVCQAIPACLAASAGVTPRSVTSKAAWSFSRSVIRHRGGNGGIGPVNVFTAHNRLPHSSRRLCIRSRTGRPPQRTSFAPVAM